MSATVPKIKSFINFGIATVAAFSLVLSTPIAAYAVDAPAPDTAACAPAPATNGTSRPNGADAATYTYNCAGYWENDHYIYTPSTGAYSNKVEPTYTYNATSGKYDFPVWVYNAPSNAYVSVTDSIVAPPRGATVIGAPPASTASVTGPTAPAASTQSISNTGAGSTNKIASDGSGGAAAINGTGASSNNTIGSTGRDSLTGNFTTVATVSNLINSQATSGSAVLMQNTTAGNATTGDAAAMANIVNLLQSTSNALGKNGNVVTFVANINGDVNGDLLLNPANLSAIQPAGSRPAGNVNLTINDQTNAAINNNLNLKANSGDATSAQNTTAGNTTSGNAQAVANIINIVESAVSAGKSFIGVININGNLNGDILLPPNFVDQLIAANVPTVTIDTTGANSTNSITNTGSNATTVSNTANSGINNNIKASAASGSATSTENTNAGNTASGTARTNITAFNLTGSNVVGGNNLLVFVNVLGSWVGLIVNAPAGATAASLGGGITQNTPVAANTSTNITRNAAENINNNVNVAANSGNASSTQNTTVGDTKSGKADVAVNLLNIAHSTLSLSNWFGVLFINVFGSWHGSFGINTSAGDPVPTTNSSEGGNTTLTAPVVGTTPAPFRIFHFAPHAATANSTRPATPRTSTTSTGTGQVSTASASTTEPVPSQIVLGAHTIRSVASPVQPKTTNAHYVKLAAGVGILMLVFLASDYILSRRRRA